MFSGFLFVCFFAAFISAMRRIKKSMENAIIPMVMDTTIKVGQALSLTRDM